MAVAARLVDRCAIVTGAADGIGAAAAARFAEEGAGVACLDVAPEQVAAAVSHAGGRTIAVRVDVADEASIESAVRCVLAEFGRLDIVCNAAATTGPPCAVAEMPTDGWDRTVAVNLRGTFLVAKHTLSALGEARGNIVNVASALGLTGWRREAAYGPTNAGILQLTQAMALDYAPEVRVNCVCPGPITGTSPLGGRPVEPSEVADGILFLASDEASYMTGSALPIDGGFLAS